MEFLQDKLVVKDPQARRPSSPEVATKHPARNEPLIFKCRAEGSRKIIRQRPSRPEIVKQSRFLLVKASRHAFTVDRANTSGPYADSSLVWIALPFSPLSVKKRIITHCSI
jgi:hypothetical protein